MDPVPKACELFAHQAPRSSGNPENAVLASNLTAFYDFLKLGGPWISRSAGND